VYSHNYDYDFDEVYIRKEGRDVYKDLLVSLQALEIDAGSSDSQIEYRIPQIARMIQLRIQARDTKEVGINCG
jgi:hypothetical protein